jgi:phosphate transport system ATP-binding protein
LKTKHIKMEQTLMTAEAIAYPTTSQETVEYGLEVKNVAALYGSYRAIKNINMDIQPRKITAFIGPSGCGKSTLIRCLNRMHEVVRGATVEGQVLLNGEDIYAPDADPVRIRRRIGMVFQKPNPFPSMSIYDNVLAGYKLNNGRLKKNQADEIVENSLRSVALWDEVKMKLKRSGIDLSGGQQQRLCIARTIAVQPDIVLMDEPCSALDPIATQRIEELMRNLVKDYTIVIVTHNMQQATRVSDYTAFFNIRKSTDAHSETRWGELVEFGATEQVFNAPAQQETADYISGRFG